MLFVVADQGVAHRAREQHVVPVGVALLQLVDIYLKAAGLTASELNEKERVMILYAIARVERSSDCEIRA